MGKTNWSEYQKRVFDFVENGKGSAVVSAVAGSGKTTTIVECSRRIERNKSVLFVAFNKSIVRELSERLAEFPNVQCKTMHSHGFSAIRKSGFGRVDFDDYKYKNYFRDNAVALSSIIDEECEDSDKRVFTYNVTNLFAKCRINLIKGGDRASVQRIADHHSFDLIADEIDVVTNELYNGYRLQRGDRKINYDDQIVLACTQFARYIPKYDYIFVDECQDLNVAQRTLLMASLAPNGRFIGVGDKRQAINGFAGASNDSFDQLAKLANGNELPLSVNYRCGKSIISLANEIVPEIKAFEGSKEGKVHYVSDLKDVKGGDMILCRKTAPLICLCLKFLASGITASVKGKDIGDNLINFVEKMKAKNIPSLFTKMDKEYEKLRKEEEKKGKEESAKLATLKDKIECVTALAESVTSIAELKKLMGEIFSEYAMKNAIQLSTVHKSKGLEANNVFIIVPDKLPLVWKGQQNWEYEQEMNLRYVAITRAKDNLYFVNLDEEGIAGYTIR